MKVLVAAASKHGSTEEIARVIGDVLGAHGLGVTVSRPDAVSSLDGFDAVVLGSAVHAGHWMKTMKELVDRHGADLRARPVWLFSSGPLGDPPKPDEEPADAAPLMAATGARDHRVFAGRLERSGLGFAERAMVKAVKAPYGDFRDWSAIRAWADSIAAQLAALAKSA